MESFTFSFALAILLLSSFTISFDSTTDKNALVTLKNSITSDPYAILHTNWSENAPVCNWIGVSCGLKHPRVTALNLSGYDLAGTIAPHLGNITFMRYLDISSNSFTGSLPSELSKLRRLTVMNVGMNSFTGEIPTWLGSLPQLEGLYLYSNQLSGSIPHAIFNVSSIREIGIENNSLSGLLPSDMCNKMPNIKILSLDYNRLGGEIPSNIWKCTHLEMLSLSYNNFSGNIPREIGRLSFLTNLFLGHNIGFGGGVPREIGNLTRLEMLGIEGASLTGDIPSSIFNISSLRVLSLSHNSLSGELPQEIGTLPRLEFFSLFNNSLHGSIPSTIFNISTLKNLAVSFNEFSGTLPSYIGHSLISLEVFFVSFNRLSGPIPTSITNSSKLTYLDMIANSFSGSIPHFGNLNLLQVLLLSGNNLSGAKFPTQELTFLSSLTNCRYLNRLGVSGNPLSGILPSSLGNFSSSLETFEASQCNIKGVIPSQVGNLSSLLYSIYLDGNQLSGPIPPTLWTLKYLTFVSLSSNSFNGQLPNQLGNLKLITFLDLSFNKFSGDIPFTIGGCQSLAFLDLSNNRFGGVIPYSLGNVRGLTILDLSYNKLSGSIPNSLVDLPLQKFNVSNNELEGRIPDSGCFVNLTAQSFAHNFALCGPMRFLVQPCPKDDGGSRVKKNAQLIKYMVLSIMLVVLTVIFMLVLIWRQKKKRLPLSDDVSPLTIEWIRMRNRRRISYIELEQGTRSFSEANLLGRGNYGYVFRATLADGLRVAVKVFNFQQQGATESFDTETEILGSIRHRNLVRLVGWCSYREFRALIVTYMPNGSLDDWLHSNIYAQDLIQRLQIAIDVASALEYLHHGYTSTIVHSNVKPSNVLLDQDMVAHLSDFGISKLFDGGEGIIHTQAPTTIGYAAPELETEGKVSTNGDVYSFGIMLLEIFTGKRPTDKMFGEQMSLKKWASEALQQNAVNEIVVPALFSRQDQHYFAKEQCVSSVFELAIKCLAVSPHERINMIKAAMTLHKIKETIVASTERPRMRYAYPVRI